MPALGFGSSVGSRLPDLANFPQSGLVALYKCDEREGDRLVDATGKLQPIILSTGVALDLTTNVQYVADGSSLHSAFSGAAFDAIIGFEGITPALASTGTTHRVISGSTSSDSPIHLWLAELAYTGSNKFGFGLRTRTTTDGVTANRDKNTEITEMPGIPASTPYQAIVQLYTAGLETRAKFMYRIKTYGPWTSADVEVGADFVTSSVFLAAGAFRLFSSGASTNPYKGHISSVFIAKAMPLSAAMNIMDRPTKTNVQNVLADYTSRYWEFRNGTGSNAQEWKNDTTAAITGTVTWAGALPGITQSAIRQGAGYYGKPGIALGGEVGFPGRMGYGTTGVHDSALIGTQTGWTVLATLRVGNRVPATDQFLFSVYGPCEDGTYSTTPTTQPGVHLVLDDAALLRAVIKRAGTSTAGAGSEAQIGVTSASASNGLFGTYAITCDATGATSAKRVVTGDTSVTTQGVVNTASILNLSSRATRVAVGNASFAADLVIGFCAIYDRPLTDAEILQCHKSSLPRMRGAELYALAASPGGNGTERYPYAATLSMLRVHQPNQIANWGTGSYARVDQSASTTAPSSSENITWRGTGSPTFTPGAAFGDYPTILQAGTWSFSGIVWDANNAAYYGMSVSQDVESVSFTNCEWKNGHRWVDPPDGTLYPGGSTATGSGITSRAGLTTIINCTATDNDEHGVYLRIVGEDAVDQRCIIDGLTVTGGGEDGLKMSNEGAYGARWRNCIINRVKVVGGQFLMNLDGLADSIITNFLLIGQNGAGSSTCSILAGRDRQFSGETLVSDYPLENVTFANGVIYDGDHVAIWVRGDSPTGNVVFKNIVSKGNVGDLLDDTTAGTVTTTYCAGDSETNAFPVGTGNIPAATIAFTDSGAGDYTLTEVSDGYAMGVNLTGLSNEVEVMFDGTTRRPPTGAWNMGAY